MKKISYINVRCNLRTSEGHAGLSSVHENREKVDYSAFVFSE